MYASALASRRAGVEAELNCDREAAIACYLESSHRLVEARDAQFQRSWARGEADEGADLRTLQCEVGARSDYLVHLHPQEQACPIERHLGDWPEDRCLDNISARSSAACAGLAVGAVLGGAPLAVCAGVGMAWAAGDSSGYAAKAGEAVSSTVGGCRTFNDRHDITGRAWDAAAQAATSARTANQEYDFSGQAYRASCTVVEEAKRADQDFDVSGKAYSAASTVAVGLWSGASAVAGGLWSLRR